MKTLVVVNRAAGGGVAGRRAPEAVQRLRDAGWDFDVAHTHGPRDATSLVRRAWKAGTRRFIAVGGDGTSFEMLNGLPLDGERPVFGFLPLGTGNSFIRDFGILDEDAAMRALLHGTTRPVDVVECTHTQGSFRYLNLLSMGFTGRVTAMANRHFKALGARGYDLAVVLCLATHRFPSFPFALDGGALDARPISMLSFCNSQFTGGTMHMAPGAKLDDGKLDIINIQPMGRVTLLRAFPSIFRGEHVQRDDIETPQAAQVRFELDGPIDVMVDGEMMHIQPTALRVLPGAIEVLA